MHVRVARLAGLAPERLRTIVTEYEVSGYLDEVAGLPGFVAYLLGVDTRASCVVGISAWREQADMEASEELADAARAARLSKAKPVRTPLVRRYRIMLRTGQPQAHGWMRLSRLAGITPEAVDDLVHAFRETDYVEQLARLGGFGGYLFGVDRDGGESIAISNWDTRPDMEASHRIAEAARQLRIQATQPTEEPLVDRYEIAQLRGVDTRALSA